MCTEGSEQRADTDSGSAEVVDLINLQAGINLAASGQNLINLIGGNGIKSASEGIQLDQIQILSWFLQNLRQSRDGSDTSTGR